jgi:hypothetical protein
MLLCLGGLGKGLGLIPDHLPIVNLWFQRLALQRVSFPSKRVFIEEVLPSLVNMTLTKFVQPASAKCLTATYTFDKCGCLRGPTMFL